MPLLSHLLALTVIFFISLFFSGLFSMLEAAIISQDKHRLWHLADEGNENAIVMRHLLSRSEKLLGAVLLCNNLANITCATVAATLVTRLLGSDESILFATTLIVTFIILVCSEITPKVIGVRHAQRISLTCAKALRILLLLLAPLISTANFFSTGLLSLLGMRHQTVLHTAMNIKELRAVVRAAGRADNQEENNQHYTMLEKTLRFNEIPVEKIMTPRPDIVGINLSQDEITIQQQITQSPFSKLPIFDGNIDNTKGIINLSQAILRAPDTPLSTKHLLAIATPIHYIPAAATALKQLQIMRQQQLHLALVLDGTGRVVGLLTFANFAAAIIGDETPPTTFHQQENGIIDVPADMTLIQLEQIEPRLQPPETTATTLNGLILEYLGDLPDAPACLTINDCRLEITDLDDKSIRQVRIFPPHSAPENTTQI